MSGQPGADSLKNRRVLHWDRIKGFRTRVAVFVATGFGPGLSPIAPGTAGTLIAVPIVYALAGVGDAWRIGFWGAVLIAGIWAATVFDQVMETKDNQHIAIDEVLGYALTAWTVGDDLLGLAAAFVLFRFFDIVKPWPVGAVDRWSHARSGRARWYGGFGVIADDLAAGLQGLIVMILLQRFGVLP